MVFTDETAAATWEATFAFKVLAESAVLRLKSTPAKLAFLEHSARSECSFGQGRLS
jgi:hypothetical protein